MTAPTGTFNPKVLLANPPWQRDGRPGVRAGSRWPHIKDRNQGNYLPFPFFLAHATSLLRSQGIEAELVDAIAEDMSREHFISHLTHRQFDVFVAETSVPSFVDDMALLKEISNLGKPIVLCGPNTNTHEPKFLLDYGFIDFVMFGEYEVTLLELARAIAEGNQDYSHIEGLLWRDEKGKLKKNAERPLFDLDILPWPQRDGLPMEKYWDLPGGIPYPSVQMSASRGCPFSCNFCLWPQVMFGGRNYRARDTCDVADEMEHLVREKGFKSVYFDDDTFNIGKDRMEKLCEEIRRRDLADIPWAIMARPDLMSEKLLDTFKKSGLFALKYGIESASQELVDRCGKSMDLAKAERNILYTKSLGIRVHLTFCFGLPGETADTIKKTMDFALRMDPFSLQFSVATPFPGTSLFTELDQAGRIAAGGEWSLFDGNSSCVFTPENLSREDLEIAKDTAYELWRAHQRNRNS